MAPVTAALFIAGLVLLIAGAEALVRGASRLAAIIGISPLVIGLTVVAYGTSSPELAIAVQSSLSGQSDIALGNVVGSNIANVLLVLGSAAVIRHLLVSERLLRIDGPLMVGVSLLMFGFSLDGNIGRIEGLILFAGAVIYTTLSIWHSRKVSRAIVAEYTQEFGISRRSTNPVLYVAFIGIGLVFLIIGSRLLMDGAVDVARQLGVSELVVGLTIVAVGTSLPEIAISMVASARGQGDIAAGNVVGSNIFNILLVLGLASVLAPQGIDVSSAALNFDIPVMIAVAIGCLPVFFIGKGISRWEGVLFLGYYLAYTSFLILNSAHHSALPMFNVVMLAFVIPITTITLFVLVALEVRTRLAQNVRK